VRNELVVADAAADAAAAEGSSIVLRARATGEEESIPAGLVLRAIGYRGRPLPGVPFDERRGVIRNERGRVLDGADGGDSGEYAVGWIKRGPTGVIGTNKKDAQETVDAILADLRDGRLPDPPLRDPQELERLLRERQPDLVTYEGWTAIDRHERALGEPGGRPRVKLTTIEEMLHVAAAESPAVPS
jgi:ferredoxin/flavodoxin---NADP+ reductase